MLRATPSVCVFATVLILVFASFLYLKKTGSITANTSHDPRLKYAGPFQNIHPSVKYVGDQACVGCHDNHIESFAKHPMGRAMATMAESTPIEKYDLAAKNPFVAGGFQYFVSPPGQGAKHREELAPSDTLDKLESNRLQSFHQQMKARFAVGSGAKARSYLMEQDGFLFQSPCTWYRRESRWDLSPSFEIRNQHFSRTVTPGCVFCHANQADHIEGTENRYREPIFHGLPIGCERCHGPGEKHVEARLDSISTSLEKGEMDPTIVNPKWLDHSLRQAICEQCHVQGEQRVVGRGLGDFDFRPGLPLQDFLMDFVDKTQKTGGFKFVSSVEQMMQSQCYVATSGKEKLGCTSCHDPHNSPEKPSDRLKHFREKCLACHSQDRGQTPCGLNETARLSRQPENNCVACHMPQNAAEVNHSSITDHSIPRIPNPPGPAGHRPTPGPHDLVPFHAHLVGPENPEVRRNLGLARMNMLVLGLPPKLAREMAVAAISPLEEALQRDPEDWPAVESYADALLLTERANEAATLYRKAARARPHFEKTRFGAGVAAFQLNLLDEAISHLSEAVRINPHHPGYQHDLAVACLRKGDLVTAEKACRAALDKEPSREKSRSLLILVLLRMGRGDAATAELELLRLTTPANQRADLNKWFVEAVSKQGNVK